MNTAIRLSFSQWVRLCPLHETRHIYTDSVYICRHIYTALSMWLPPLEAVSVPQTCSSGLLWSATCGSTKRIIIIIIIGSFFSALVGEISDPFVLIRGLVLFDGVAVPLYSVNASELASSRTTWTFPRRCESALTDPRCVYSVFIKGWQRETKA